MNVAIILAGGTGTRMSTNVPKQYIEVGGKLIIEYCLEQLLSNPNINYIQIVVDAKWRDVVEQCVTRIDKNNKVIGYSEPGINRQLSILNGLKDIRDNTRMETKWVLIHDAARPNLKEEFINKIFDEVKDENVDGVLPVIPMKDTIYYSDDTKTVSKLLDRQKLYAGQAPELFSFDAYYKAVKRLSEEEILRINGSTEPAILAGMNIKMISGDEDNFKVTTMADLDRFRELVDRRK